MQKEKGRNFYYSKIAQRNQEISNMKKTTTQKKGEQLMDQDTP